MPFRIRCIGALAAAALLVGPAAARAVTLTEFDIEPGAPAGTHRPAAIRPGPDATLWYADQGSARGVGRATVFGERLPAFGDGTLLPVDVLPGQALATSSTGLSTARLGIATPVAGTLGASGITLDAAGEVVYSYGASTSAAVCKAPAACGSVAGVPGGATELILGPDGRVWGVAPGADAVISYASSAGATPSDGRLVQLPVGSYPYGLTAGADGNVWVTALTGDRVDRITTGGQRTPFPLPAGTQPHGITSGPDGALWIAGGNGTVLRMSTAGQVTGTFTTASAQSVPSGITVGPDGAIWFTELNAGKLGKITLDPITPGSGGTPDGRTPGGATGGTIRDTARPRFLRSPAFSPSSVRLGRDAKLVVALSEPARLRIALGRRTTGRRVGGACVKATGANRRRASCARYPTSRTLTRTGVSGATAIAIATRGLRTGTYRATVTATDPAGNTSALARATLTTTRSH